MKRILLVSLAVLPLAFLPGSAAAQVLPAPALPGPGRVVFDAFVAGHRPEAVNATTRGLGARLLYALDAENPAAQRSLLARALVGAFVTRTEATPERTAQRPRTLLHAGLEADWLPFGRPLGGRIDPFVSLSVGALHVEPATIPAPPRSATRATLQIARGIDASRTAQATTNMTVAPGVGVRATVLPGLALRLDVRDAVAFTPDASHTLELAGGISLRR